MTFLKTRLWIVGSAIVILCGIVSGQNWVVCSSPTTNALWGVTFVDTLNGWVVGEGGTILHTTDGGVSWNSQTSNVFNFFYDVAFYNLNNGWAVGDLGVICHTTNGGATWSGQQGQISNTLWSVACADRNNVWAGSDYSLLQHTTNGGTNWSLQNTPPGTSTAISGLAFANASIGWAVGGLNAIWRTTNGGTNWIAQSVGSPSDVYTHVAIADSNSALVGVMTGQIMRTSNAGMSWIRQTVYSYVSWDGVALPDINHGWIVGAYGFIYRTTNAGINWTAQTSGTGYRLHDVSFTDINHGWAVGDHGTILRYYDTQPTLTQSSPCGGENWAIEASHTITWTSQYLIGTVNIELDRNFPSGSWENIVTGAANSGTYSWTVTGPVSSTARIRILSVNNPAVGDTSNADFSISNPLPPDAPDDVVITPLPPHIQLNWNRVAGSNIHYEVYFDSLVSGTFNNFIGTTTDLDLCRQQQP